MQLSWWSHWMRSFLVQIIRKCTTNTIATSWSNSSIINNNVWHLGVWCNLDAHPREVMDTGPYQLTHIGSLYIQYIYMGSVSPSLCPKLVIACQTRIQEATMSRGGSFGGGQSSLGYLFGSDQQPSPPSAKRTVQPPPYGIDTIMETPQESSTNKRNVSNNYQRAEGQNSGNFITVSYIQRISSNQ